APPVPQQAAIEPRGGGGGGGHSGGSIGTLVVVLAAITILGVLAGVVARICGGRHLTGDGDYDFEGWVENKCSTCIDGTLSGGAAHSPPKPSADEAPPPKAASAGEGTGKGADEEDKKDGDADAEKSPAQ
ncbi:hypothetical protein KI387_013572, partial [Taxus chinensis]